MAEENGGTPEQSGTPEVPPVETPNPAAAPETPPAETPPVAAPDPKEPAAEPPKDWAAVREQFAKGDEKLLKRLSRYSSLESALEAMVAAQDKIAKGEHKVPLAEDATPEEVAAWREANGIPATAKDYKVELDEGLVIGELDQPVVDGFLGVAHELNLKPADVNKTLNWYFAEQEKQAELRNQQDEQLRVSANEELASPEVWGSEAKLNKNLILGMLDQAPAGVKDSLLSARAADGTPLGSHTPTLRWLADIARELNPVATVVPGSGTNAMQTIETEIAGLEKMMGDRGSDYWKGPMAQKHQARYLELVDVRQKLQK